MLWSDLIAPYLIRSGVERGKSQDLRWLIWIGGYLAFVTFIFSLGGNKASAETSAHAEQNTAIANQVHALMTQIVLSQTPTLTPTMTMIPTMKPTATMTPTNTKVPPEKFLFSYYDPDMGGVNCHPDTWILDKDGACSLCKDTTASGLTWRDKFGRSVAIPYSMGALGGILRVVDPEVLRGYYVVIDYCPACDKPEGRYIDFLLGGMPDGITWSWPVHAYYLPPGG